jgi:hypothetical protein
MPKSDLQFSSRRLGSRIVYYPENLINKRGSYGVYSREVQDDLPVSFDRRIDFGTQRRRRLARNENFPLQVFEYLD